MKMQKFWYFAALLAITLLPLAGCSGGNGSTITPGESGKQVTVAGKVDAKAVSKAVGATAGALGTVKVFNAYSTANNAALGSAEVLADGTFSNLTFTLPATKSVVVFKFDGPPVLRNVTPIDLSNPPAGLVNNNVTITIDAASTAAAAKVATELGLSGQLGDVFLKAENTYAAVMQSVLKFGGQVLAYTTNGITLTGNVGNSLLPAVDASTLTSDDLLNLQLNGEVTTVAIPDTGKPVISFQVTNKATGKGISGLKTFAVAVVQLKPGVDGSPDTWQSYMVGSATARPGTETVTGAALVDNGDGSYTATLAKDIKTAVDYQPAYNADLTHRVGIQVRTAPGGSFTNAINVLYDFVPSAGKATDTMLRREIVTTAACNECHTKIGTTTPHGGRVETGFCAACHTSQRANGRTASTSSNGVFTGSTYIADGEVTGEFVTMVHKIHMGSNLTKTGYNYANVLFNEVGYPQNIANCRTCHKGDTPAQLAAAPQANNWKTKPSRQSCGACHDNVNFVSGANHIGGKATNDKTCNLCHDAASVESYHATGETPVSPNNPVAKTGLANFTYEIASAAVNTTTNDLTIKFRILKDGTAVTFVDPAATVTNSLTGFTGNPSFMLAYAQTQDGITAPADFNNLGKASAQPATVAVNTLLSTNSAAVGSLSTRDADGYYTATIKSTSAFPVGAKLRTVALQAYYTQAAGTNGIAAATARHTLSAVKTITGDTKRRVVIDPAKCASCHEVFEGHGGNRNIGKATGTTEPNVCVLCHVPNLSSSGTTQQLGVEEATQNFKDMIHAIHAGAFREEQGGAPYIHYRGKSNPPSRYDWSHVKFPGVLNKCEMCHIPGTYSSVPAAALVTTDITTATGVAPVSTAEVTAARASLPNANDKVISPFTAACVSCHNSAAAKAHMSGNGALLNVARSTANAEQCAICHGTGRSADATSVHK